MPPLGSSSREGAGLGRTLADPAVDSRDLPGRSASQPPMAPKVLTNAMEETRHGDVELTEHWDLIDHHIPRLLEAMTADLLEGSPVGRLYGESLANTLAVYLAGGYAVRRSVPVVYKGGLPVRRLKMVLDYIGDNLAEDLSLSQLAAVGRIRAHYFSARLHPSTGLSSPSFG